MGKMECATIRRGYFRGSTAAENTGTFGIAGSVHRPWDSNPSRKNEIECCVDRLNPPPKADIHEGPDGSLFAVRCVQTGNKAISLELVDEGWVSDILFPKRGCSRVFRHKQVA